MVVPRSTQPTASGRLNALKGMRQWHLISLSWHVWGGYYAASPLIGCLTLAPREQSRRLFLLCSQRRPAAFLESAPRFHSWVLIRSTCCSLELRDIGARGPLRYSVELCGNNCPRAAIPGRMGRVLVYPGRGLLQVCWRRKRRLCATATSVKEALLCRPRFCSVRSTEQS